MSPATTNAGLASTTARALLVAKLATRRAIDAQAAAASQVGVALICAVGSCQAPGEVVEGCPGGRAIPATGCDRALAAGCLSPVGRPGGPSAERLTGAVLALLVLVCARVPMLISVHDLGLAPGRRHDGDGVPARGRAERPLSLWRPSTRAWRQRNAGSWPRCIGLRFRRARTRGAHAGASPSSPRSLRVW